MTNPFIVMICTMKTHWSVDYFMEARILQRMCTERKTAVEAEITNVVSKKGNQQGFVRIMQIWQSPVMESLESFENFYGQFNEEYRFKEILSEQSMSLRWNHLLRRKFSALWNKRFSSVVNLVEWTVVYRRLSHLKFRIVMQNVIYIKPFQNLNEIPFRPIVHASPRRWYVNIWI